MLRHPRLFIPFVMPAVPDAAPDERPEQSHRLEMRK